MIETDRWPFVPARWYTKFDGTRVVREIVIHDMEYPEKMTAAEEVARYFQNPLNAAKKPVKASAHVCIDADSVVQCVRDNNIAYAAPGANGDGIQLELSGYGRQTTAQWLDEYSKKLLNLAANVTAQYCLKYAIPVCHMTNTQLADKTSKGIIGHYQASQVFKLSDHTDPGPNFPWEYFMELVAQHYAARKTKFGI